MRIQDVETVHDAVTAVTDRPARLEDVFAAHYDAVARLIARVIRDPARAEEIAVDVFLRWSEWEPEFLQARLYRAAARAGLDELRRRTARSKYEGLFGLFRRTPTPEEVYHASEEQDRVRQVLCALDSRQAELVLLRGQDLSYKEIAAAMGIQPGSAGTLLARAQGAFRKEYVKRYGQRQ